MTTELTREQARNIARVLHAVHQRRAAREEAERHRQDSKPRPEPTTERGDDDAA